MSATARPPDDLTRLKGGIRPVATGDQWATDAPGWIIADLEKSDISPAVASAARLAWTDSRERIGDLLNRRSPLPGGACLLFPYFNAAGKPLDYCRVKPERPRAERRDGEERVVKYEAPSRCPPRLYIPPAAVPGLLDPEALLIVTEGEKKVLSLIRHGFLAVGVAGVWNLLKKGEGVETGRTFEDYEFHWPEDIAVAGRLVILLFDSDTATKGNLPLALKYIREHLGARGATVRVARLPDAPNGEKVGADDYLVTHGPAALRQILDAAEDKPSNSRHESNGHAGRGGYPKPTPPPRHPWPAPLSMSELAEHAGDVDFLWHGCIARGHVTLLSALMKAGKSTLLGHLLRALQAGTPFLGRVTKPARTLIVSEESPAQWRRRVDALDLDDSAAVLCRPMLARPDFATWSEFVAYLGECAAKRQSDLVVIDTIAPVAPWKNENDAAEVQGTLTPLNGLTRNGLAVLLVHHLGKADQPEGKAARGSTALAGGVDVLLEFRRYRADDRADRRRVLTGLGRFEEVPEEIVVQLSEDGSGYTAEGDRRAVEDNELVEAIRAALPNDSPGWTRDEIKQQAELRCKLARLLGLLNLGVEASLWARTGTGKKGDPWRFWRP
ncbi:MAG TPA: AAA family ATPase [Gemmataceae bacterium]|nr:AAA family ATPase [Gemmataceae bacterium]